MSTAAALDLRTNVPTAFALSRALHTPLGFAEVDPDAYSRLIVKRATDGAPTYGGLPALETLAALWSPLYEAGRRPSLMLAETIEAALHPDSYELRFFREELARARVLSRTRFYEQEIVHLERERKAAPESQQAAFSELLLGCTREIKCVQNRSVTRIDPGATDPALAQWVVSELEHFLQGHWAMYQTRQRIQELLRRRSKLLKAYAGIVAIDEFQAESHDDV